MIKLPGIPPYDPNLHDGYHLEAWEPDAVEPVMKQVRRLARSYFRAEITGWENVPSQGQLLVVGNHNGGFVSPDMFIFFTAWFDHFGGRRALYALTHSGAFTLSELVAGFMARAGAVRASREMARRVLSTPDASLMIYPGGGVDLFRPFTDRYKVELAGHKGFIRLALEFGVPILPVVSCGAHESAFILASNRRLMKLLGLSKLKIPVWPIMFSVPWGLTFMPVPNLPLPTRVQIHLEQPITLEDFSPEDANNEAVVDALYQRVRSVMQARMDTLAAQRNWPILG